ncbi:minor tail protein [Mycobacterium phage Whirlwind]|uniref:Minor tail protein n=1 Tax=Mycobacterium phage Whirlwind TaxID=1340826 RepID=S5YMG4_9CAUD|nr:minor tail protein [Mycobacterium phage Whirlwind]AGT12628.1 minor tail protein [Mycobacterium phage Whirlwind]
MPKTQAESNLDDPKEMFAWMFAAGVPDPRDTDGKFPNQPLIPPMCFPALSEMLYKMGARFHPELQTMWVKPGVGPERNFQANGTTDIKPEDIEGDVAEMLADQFPEIAQKIREVTPATHQAALEQTSKELLANLAELKKARAQMEGGSA